MKTTTGHEVTHLTAYIPQDQQCSGGRRLVSVEGNRVVILGMIHNTNCLSVLSDVVLPDAALPIVLASLVSVETPEGKAALLERY